MQLWDGHFLTYSQHSILNLPNHLEKNAQYIFDENPNANVKTPVPKVQMSMTGRRPQQSDKKPQILADKKAPIKQLAAIVPEQYLRKFHFGLQCIPYLFMQKSKSASDLPYFLLHISQVTDHLRQVGEKQRDIDDASKKCKYYVDDDRPAQGCGTARRGTQSAPDPCANCLLGHNRRRVIGWRSGSLGGYWRLSR